MRPTRKIIAEFVGVFLIGGLAGGCLTWGYFVWYYNDSHITGFMSRTNDPDVLIKRLNKRYQEQYHLSPEELQRIQPTLNEMAQSMYKVRRQFGVDVISTLDTYHQKIAAQLTPEHRDEYQKASAERRKHLAGLLEVDQGSPSQGQK